MTWTWNASYQQLFDNAKSIIKADVCMKFYDGSKPLYSETDASGVSLGAAMLQLCNNTVCQKGVAPNNITLCPIVFASKSVIGAEWRYSNIECEVLGILHGLEKFHHYFLGVRGAGHHRPQTTGSYVQKGCGHTFATYTALTVKKSSI